MEQIVLLNSDWTFLNFINFRKAILLQFKNKVEIIKYSDKEISTLSGKIKIPSVVRLVDLVKSIYKRKNLFYSKNNVFLRDNFTCAYCGKQFNSKSNLTIDHIIPVSRGGKNSYENCITSCKKCNHLKGNKLLPELNWTLLFKPYSPSVYDIIMLKLKLAGYADLLNTILKGI
jgi:5-methylcytosine-specific restriction endonuclease McrA